MVNISIYHTNVLEGSDVTTTGVADGSSSLYVFDDKLSFAFTTAAGVSGTVFQIDQPADDVRDFRYLALMNHVGMDGGTAIVTTYPTAARNTPTVIISGAITADPMLFDADSVQSGKRFVDAELIASGTNSVQLGEMGLVSKFVSPKSPVVNVSSSTALRTTFIPMPNSERRGIQHAPPGRSKTYRITGLTKAEAIEWRDRYAENKAIKILILTDDLEETYPVLWNTALPQSRELDVYTVELEFVEVRL